MNKATPIPDSVHRIANGSMEKATCLPCGGGITRAKYQHHRVATDSVATHSEDKWFAWWHIETGHIPCERRDKK